MLDEKLFSPEGVTTWLEMIAHNPELAKAAEGWETALAFVREAQPEKGLGEAVAGVRVKGGCWEALPGSPEEALLAAEYVFRGSGSTWRAILGGQLDPVFAVFSGKLKLVRGNVASLSSRVGAARELLAAAQKAAQKLGITS